ncbi:MAG TPA: DNA alkylation repair protein, partial [Kofleriaceae bacterium]|nr:DNA alkylation repair protein [Kofleriaceae bacterium]
ALRRLGTAERRRVSGWYFPSKMQALGVTVPDLRGVSRSLRASLKKADPKEVIALAKQLIATEIFEARAVAYELLDRRADVWRALGAKGIEAMGKGNDNWGSVDHYGTIVAGPAWREGVIADTDVIRWARSRDRWWRRTALVATVALNKKARGGAGDPKRTLAICELLVDDRDDMVVKAMSWALRSLGERDAPTTKRWIDEHEPRLAKRVLREVRTKLTTGRKTSRHLR